MPALTVGFDHDMTLVDSRPGIAEAYRALSARTGIVPRMDGMCVWFELDLPNGGGGSGGLEDEPDLGSWTTELD